MALGARGPAGLGWIGFATLLYFLATGFVEPLHTAAAAVLLPMFLLATRRTRQTIHSGGCSPKGRKGCAARP